MSIDPEEFVEFLEDLEAVSAAVRNSVEIPAQGSEGSAIWLHDGGRFDASYRAYAEQLCSLLLLYDKIYWFSPCTNLFDPSFSVDGGRTAFAKLLSELVECRLVVPVGAEIHYSAPVEFAAEHVVLDHLIACPHLDFNEWPSFHIFQNKVAELGPALASHASGPRVRSTDTQLLAWDMAEAFVMSQAFPSASLFAGNAYSRTVWQRLIELSGTVANTPVEGYESIELVNRFIERTLIKAPVLMSVHDLMYLREDATAQKMRRWFKNQYDNVRDRVISTDPLLPVVAEFNKMAQTYGNQQGYTVANISFSAIVGAMGAFLGDIPGALIGAGGTALLLPKIQQLLGSKIGKNRWIVTYTNFPG